MTKPRNPWKTVAIAACVIAVCALAIAAVAVVVNLQRTNDIAATQDQIIAARTDARVAACHSFNDDLAAKVNRLNDVDQHTLDEFVNPPGQPARAADRQAEIDAFLAQRKQDYQAAKVEPRNCTPAGIAAFYAKQAGG